MNASAEAQEPAPSGPVFIVGAPRSGTSMLHWSLAQHPELWGSAESDFLFGLAAGARQAWADGTRFGEHHWLVKEDVSRGEFFRSVGLGLGRLYRSRSNGLRWLEQTPAHVTLIPELRAMFPGARFIHVLRDGRQAVHSMTRKFDWPFRRALRTWRDYVRAGMAARDPARKDLLEVRYEDVVTAPGPTMDGVFDFIDESRHEPCVRFLDTPINTAPGTADESPRDKLDPSRVPWGPLRRALFSAICGREQRALGYPMARRSRAHSP